MWLVDKLGQLLRADRVEVDLDLELLERVFDRGDHGVLGPLSVAPPA